VSVSITKYRENNPGYSLAFSIQIQPRSRQFIEPPLPGTLLFLPSVGMPEDDAVLTLLRDLCQVEVSLPEPEWLATYKVPGQTTIEAEIDSIEREILERQQIVISKRANIKAMQDCQKLLYERHDAFEQKVRDVLGELGGGVEPPLERNKEDGWITYTLADGTNLDFVLEAKSTDNAQVGEHGLRQLLDWKNRGLINRQKRYKGLLVPITSPSEEPRTRSNPFPDAWIKTAVLSEIVALSATDLYDLCIADREGRLNRDQFWKSLHETNGVLQIGQLLQSQSTRTNEHPSTI